MVCVGTYNIREAKPPPYNKYGVCWHSFFGGGFAFADEAPLFIVWGGFFCEQNPIASSLGRKRNVMCIDEGGVTAMTVKIIGTFY